MRGVVMRVYHGSYMQVIQPDIKKSRMNVDFGQGFYITPIMEQAYSWARRFKKSKGQSIVSVYELDMERCKNEYVILEFDGYTEAWLDYIMLCRKAKVVEKYDIIIGGVANDKVFNTIELFFDGLIEKTEAIKRLRYEKPNLQICIRNQEIIDKYLKYIEEVEL